LLRLLDSAVSACAVSGCRHISCAEAAYERRLLLWLLLVTRERIRTVAVFTDAQLRGLSQPAAVIWLRCAASSPAM
jgi:hypothetical protein